MNKLNFILLLLLFFLSGKQLYAYNYDPLLMRAQASLFPKIILLDKDLDKKISASQIILTILYSTKDHDSAQYIKDLIEAQYQHNLGNKQLIVNLSDFDNFNDSSNATAYFLLKSTASAHNKITLHASKQKRLVFCYDYKDFDSNALISVLMKEKTYIYLNKSAIHDYDIKFLPLFYKIVKVIE